MLSMLCQIKNRFSMLETYIDHHIMEETMKTLINLFIIIALFASSTYSQAKRATPQEAEKWVKKAVAYYKAEGKEKAFEEFSNLKGKFVKDDLYIFVYDLTGKCVAHGFNPKFIGKDMSTLKDPDGKLFVAERIEIAKTKGKGWQNYKWQNPETKTIETKTAYIEKIENFIIGCGAYKK